MKFVLIGSGHYRHPFTEELATALRESVKAHMAAYGVTDARCSLKVEMVPVAQPKAGEGARPVDAQNSEEVSSD